MEATNINASAESFDDEKIEQNVFQIIESKIQYNDYRIKTAANSFISLEENDNAQKIPAEMKRIINSNEHIIELIRKYTGAINLLLVLRSKLNRLNADAVIKLLDDDVYLNFSKQDLLSFIGGKPHQMSA